MYYLCTHISLINSCNYKNEKQKGKFYKKN